MKQEIEKFRKETGVDLVIKDGKPFYGGSLDLRGTGITALPDNLTVGDSLDLRGTGITALPDNLTVGGYLDLSGTGITALPDNLTVGGYLDLSGTGITALPDNLTVGGYLDLENCTGITALPDNLTVGGYLDLENCTGITALPDNLTVGDSLDLRGTGITALPDNLTVGGYLDLRGTGITALPDNLTVGDSLDLRGTGITALPDNLTVGGYLDLRGTGITALPDNLTVGGPLYLSGTGITGEVKVNKKLSSKAIAAISRVSNMPIFWEWNDRSYIKVDDMFTAVDSHHGNVYRVHKLNSSEQLYLVTDSENHWAHGRTLQEARADLIFKINDRDTSVYRNMSLNDTITYEEAIAAYRTITGACAAGTKDFIENRLPKPHKDKYTIQEIIALTEKEYGGKKFSEFFKK